MPVFFYFFTRYFKSESGVCIAGLFILQNFFVNWTQLRACICIAFCGMYFILYLMNRHPCAVNIFISRFFMGITFILFARVNWYISHLFFVMTTGAQCLKYRQKILANILCVFVEKPIYIIMIITFLMILIYPPDP